MVCGLPSSLGHFGNVKTYDQLVLSGMVCCSQLLTDSLMTFAAWGLQMISALYLMREDCKQAIWYMRCVTFLLLLNRSIYLFIWPHHEARGILIPQPQITSCLGRQSLDHWTTGKIPRRVFVSAIQPRARVWLGVQIQMITTFLTIRQLAYLPLCFVRKA